MNNVYGLNESPTNVTQTLNMADSFLSRSEDLAKMRLRASAASGKLFIPP